MSRYHKHPDNPVSQQRLHAFQPHFGATTSEGIYITYDAHYYFRWNQYGDPPSTWIFGKNV